jgi:amidohydrolase
MLADARRLSDQIVADRLRRLAIEPQTGVGVTGVVGLIDGGKPGKTVLLRADMDALPIVEMGELPFRSENDGVMHACGHDGHVAMLLAAAKLLTERRGELRGQVKLMFQPAEEGGGGAMKMIDDGLMEAPNVDAAFALHVDSLLDAGKLQLRPGPLFAAADRFTILVRGKGGHAAQPHLVVDPIVVASHIVIGLQTLVSREVDPDDRAVFTVGSIHAGTAENVIPDTASILGTLRTYTPALRSYLEQRIREMSAGIAASMRASAEVDWRPGYPPVINHESAIDLLNEVALETVGPGLSLVGQPSMVAEDFSYLIERVPGAMFRLGIRKPSWTGPRAHHTSDFDMDESALPTGTAMLAATAIRYLNTH